MIWDEVRRYEKIMGENADHVPVIKLGATLDGYEKGYKAGKSDAESEYKKKLLTIYTDLISVFDGDKESLKNIDIAFETNMEEINK